MAYQPGPNELLRAARLALRSPSGSGRPLSRQELADAVITYLYEHAGRRSAVAGHYIGNLERGQTRWPSAHYRTALRAVLGKATDAELGFFIIQGHTNDPDVSPAEPLPPVGPSQAAVSHGRPATPLTIAHSPAATPSASNGHEPVTVHAKTAVVHLSMHEDTAVTVVHHDAVPPGHVAIVAGPIQVLISPADVEPVRLAPVVAGVPTVAGEARVYPIAQGRWS
ncbi:hypothetical protein EDC02_6689 [Micromonospora sp. Llam0]|uniref:hypothetical protein n=1 Tax=Micromonospora sp. Llam0 TaxID=2485143 RepID=UPI000FC222A9|nr:hypothetical protein [Micromonospora sp. Llam0]ROO51802.1 hypothetical protein EDC02_6689 [Micromonospora sp. Llam0]